MSKSYQVHQPVTRYPGSESYYALCDVCGKKYRKKELNLVEDKFNLQNRLLVCHKDMDKAQPQLRPWVAREYRAPALVRPEPAVYPQIPNPNSNMAPSAPTNLVASVDTLSNTIMLWWLGPMDNGSDPVTGYVIYQAWPQLSTILVINANTLNGAPTYQDPLTPLTASCTYYVAAINKYGIGAMSAPAFYPQLQVDFSIKYFVINQGNMPAWDLFGNGSYLTLEVPGNG